MKDLINKFLYLTERDIDLLLLEEFNVSALFAAWFYCRVFGRRNETPKCLGAWHSVTDSQFGESDLVVVYGSSEAILVENKIDAPAQPEQAARYRLRGQAGINAGNWQSFSNCIIAPKRYLAQNSEARLYDVGLSYEEIRDWFEAEGLERSRYRANVFDEAIQQNRRGYTPVAHDQVTRFWSLYWEMATESFPALAMTRPSIKPANADWPEFRPAILGKNMTIVHKMAQGYVDLQIRGASKHLDKLRSLLNTSEFDVVTAGKSAAIRFITPQVDRFEDFEIQRTKVMQALESAVILLEVGKDLACKLKSLALDL